MITKDFIIENKTSLHARPASKFVQVANEFKSDIFIEKGNTRVNAKSIMGVMTLGAGRGSKIRLIVDGIDQEEALETLSQLIQSNFGEE